MAVRNDAHLERLDVGDEDVRVVIPADTFSVTSSFFLGMFGDSIRRLGRHAFRKKYTFEGPLLDGVIDDAVQEALRTIAPLET